MALAFLATWIEPTALGDGMMKYFALIMLMEFITIHSAGFLGFVIISGKTKFQKISRVIGLGIFYSFFISSFTMPSGELWPLVTFWLLLFNRILGVLVGETSETSLQIIVIARWTWSLFCYVISMVISMKLPMPQFGWVDGISQQMGPGGAGIWYEQPHTLLAAGFMYFLLASIFEMYSHRLTATFSDINSKIPLFRNH